MLNSFCLATHAFDHCSMIFFEFQIVLILNHYKIHDLKICHFILILVGYSSFLCTFKFVQDNFSSLNHLGKSRIEVFLRMTNFFIIIQSSKICTKKFLILLVQTITSICDLDILNNLL